MTTDTGTPNDLRDTVEREFEAYDHGAGQPLPQYATTLATYGATVAGLAVLAWSRRRDRLPPLAVSDVGLLGVATFKLARVLTKDAITSPLRAPFTQYKGDSDTPAEVMERPRGRGLRRTLGELVSCPFCMSQWVGTGFSFSFVLAPRATRMVAGTLAAITAADFLQFGYVAAQNKAEG